MPMFEQPVGCPAALADLHMAVLASPPEGKAAPTHCEGGPGKERAEEPTALPCTCPRRKVHPRKGVAQSTGQASRPPDALGEDGEAPPSGHLRGVPAWPALSAWPHSHNQGEHECILSGVQMWARGGAAHSFYKPSRALNPHRRPQACPSGPALGTQGSSLDKPCGLVHTFQCASPATPHWTVHVGRGGSEKPPPALFHVSTLTAH